MDATLLETQTQALKVLLESVLQEHKDMKKQLGPIKKWAASPN